MSLNAEVEHLRSLPLFARIDPAKLKLLAFTSQRLRFKAGEVLFRQGDVGDAAFLALAGSADVFVTAGAREMKLATVEAVSIIGEIAILCDVPRTATVIAASELDTLQITKDRFWWLIAEFPEISMEFMRVLAKRLADRTEELTALRMERG
jgi:CRP-like cAMP-binding protein